MSAAQGLTEDIIYRLGVIVGVGLACNRVERTQVQRLLEIANTVEIYADRLIRLFAAYQAARNQWPAVAARLVFEAVLWLTRHGADIKAIRRFLGYCRWVHQVFERNRGACPRVDWRLPIDSLIKQGQLDPDALLSNALRLQARAK